MKKFIVKYSGPGSSVPEGFTGMTVLDRRSKNKWAFPNLISYFKDGKLHREDGPAWDPGNSFVGFFLEGKLYSEAVYWQKVWPLHKDGPNADKIAALIMGLEQ